MSWSANGTINPGVTCEQAREALDTMEVFGNDDCPSERSIAVIRAKEAVVTLVFSGAFGDPHKHGFVVNINGHCCPGNEKPADGGTADMVTVNVRQAPVVST